jgi:hypothetical protein
LAALVCVSLLSGSIASAGSLAISAASLTAFERTYGAPSTCTLSAAADAYVGEDTPATAHGSETTLEVSAQTGTRRRSLIRFDLDACSPAIPPDAIVHTASLQLTVAAVLLAGRTYRLSRVGASWSEATVTWNVQPTVAGSTATLAVALGTLPGSVVEWSVVADVQDFVTGAAGNYGWRLSDTAEGALQLGQLGLHSREAPTDPPTLVITYVG